MTSALPAFIQRSLWKLAWVITGLLATVVVMRLDHVFVSRDLGVLGVRVGEGPGSDHRPVVADLARRAAFAR